MQQVDLPFTIYLHGKKQQQQQQNIHTVITCTSNCSLSISLFVMLHIGPLTTIIIGMQIETEAGTH